MKDLHLSPVANPPPTTPEHAILVTHYVGEPHFLFHYHPEFEITLTKGGSGRRLVGSDVSPYAQSDLVLIGPGIPHTWAIEPVPDCLEPLENYVVHFTRESLGLDFLAKKELSSVRRLLARSSLGLHFSGERAAEAARLLCLLPAQSGIDRLISFLSVLRVLAGCRAARPILSAGYRPAPSVEENQRMATILDFVNRHSAESISLTAAAALLGLSQSVFSRFFRRNTGRSFIDYVNDWRISRACALLEQTRLSILEISLQTGFGNLSHFNRQFRRRCQMSPRDYRRQTQPSSHKHDCRRLAL